METIPDGYFPCCGLSPIRSIPAKSMNTTTPQTASPSSHGESLSAGEGWPDETHSDEASITLDDLIAESKPSSGQQNKDQSSSTACLASPNSSRETLDTSVAIAMSSHELAKQALKAQQRQARRTQSLKTHKSHTAAEPPTLDAFLEKTNRSPQTSVTTNLATSFESGNFLKRSKSEKTLLPQMEDESVSGGRMLIARRRRSNSFGSGLPAQNDRLFDVITRLRLESKDDDTVVQGKQGTNLDRFSDAINDGCNDSESYLRQARGRHISRQQSVRDTRSKREKDGRRSFLRTQRSAHQLRKADDFLQVSDMNRLQDLVDTWKDQEKNKNAEDLQRKSTTIQSKKDTRRKDGRNKKTKGRSREQSGPVGSREPEISDGSRELGGSTINETSKASIGSELSGNIAELDLSPIKKAERDHDSQELTLPSNSVSRDASDTSMITDTSDMIVSPYYSELREDLNVHMPVGPSFNTKRYKDKGVQRRSVVDAVSSFSDHDDDGSEVIVQFDLSQEDHIGRVRLDMTSGRLTRIECSDGPLMEGLICRMPDKTREDSETDYNSEANVISRAPPSNPGSDRHSQRPVQHVASSSNPRTQMLWRGPSSFFRRQKAQQKSADNIKPVTETMQFDENGRLM